MAELQSVLPNTSNNELALPENWLVNRQRNGPVLTTAVHAGHHIEADLLPYLNPDEELRRREEDLLTDILATTGDQFFINHNSRFQGDLNRSRDLALATDIDNTWGIPIWQSTPPDALIETYLKFYDRFYKMMSEWIEQLIDQHGSLLLLDIHSYNHRRDGPDNQPADPSENPDIDLGCTTLDANKFGPLAKSFAETLSRQPCQDRQLTVGTNVRYPDGGHWPEWVFEQYSHYVCTITLEYKKFYMDEWNASAHLPIVEALRTGLNQTIRHIKQEFLNGALR